MKSILLAASVLASALVLFVSGMVAATMIYTAGEQPHRFAGLDTADLWTNTPVVVKPSEQSFPRLAAAEPALQTHAKTIAAGTKSHADLAGHTEGQPANEDIQHIAPVQTEYDAPVETFAQSDTLPELSAEHIAWCQNRYRSYNPADNSYRPYSGGNRDCVSPFLPEPEASVASAVGDDFDNRRGDDLAASNDGGETIMYGYADESEAQITPISTRGGSEDDYAMWEHQERCMAMYRSYRPQDNSYQPYDGGPRRQCE